MYTVVCSGMANDDQKNRGGRPRKLDTERKVHRLSIALSDAEQDYANRLAELLGLSVSRSVATATAAHLHTVLLERYVGRCVDLLTKAAIETAREHADGSVSLRDGLVLLQLPNAPQAYVHPSSVQLAYDDAIRRHAESLATQAVTLDTLEQPTPYEEPQRVSVYFAWDLSKLQVARAYQRILYAGGPSVTAPAVELLTYNQPWDAITERANNDSDKRPDSADSNGG